MGLTEPKSPHPPRLCCSQNCTKRPPFRSGGKPPFRSTPVPTQNASSSGPQRRHGLTVRCPTGERPRPGGFLRFSNTGWPALSQNLRHRMRAISTRGEVGTLQIETASQQPGFPGGFIDQPESERVGTVPQYPRGPDPTLRGNDSKALAVDRGGPDWGDPVLSTGLPPAGRASTRSA